MTPIDVSRPGRPASPCVKVCRLAGDICLGCHRSLDEIARWSQMSAAQREAVWQRLDERTRRTHPEDA